MKTAVSLPDRVFQEAERYAKRTRKSRSQLYGEALSAYLARHTDEVTEGVNRVIEQIGDVGPIASWRQRPDDEWRAWSGRYCARRRLVADRDEGTGGGSIPAWFTINHLRAVKTCGRECRHPRREIEPPIVAAGLTDACLHGPSAMC